MNRSLSFLGFVLKYIRVSEIHAHAKLATFWILEISIFVDKAKKDTFNWIIICCVVVFVCVCVPCAPFSLCVCVCFARNYLSACAGAIRLKNEKIYLYVAA